MDAQNAAPFDTVSDKELVSLAKSGDTTAFSALSERYAPMLRSRACRYSNVVGVDTEDFVQEGLLALFKAVLGFDPSAGILFKTYAVTCINNSMATAVKSHMKNTARSTFVPIDGIDEQELHQKSPAQLKPMLTEDIVLAQENSAFRASQFQSLLSGFEQQVLKLYLTGHSYKQISQLLPTSTKAVDNALQRVRRKLRPEL